MTKENCTHLTLVIDRSGSMQSIREDAQGGINTLVQDQAKVPGVITVSLYQFDTEYEKVYGPINAVDAPTYNLNPRGGTALLDSMGRAINDTGKFLRDLPENERPNKVIFAVVTDGGENSSREYKLNTIKNMVEEQEGKYSWEFVYIGTNVNAFDEGMSMGMSTTVQYANTGASTRGAYAAFSSSLTDSRVYDSKISNTIANDIDEEGNATRSTSS